MFTKILIANRGEIAVRIIRACKKLSINSVAVYSEADANSLAVEMADEAVLLGAAPAAQSYLDMEKIIAAAKETGAEAVHPGFGFLSENAAFAKRLEEEGIAFIGPNTKAIEIMGDKIASKKFADKAGVNTVPGHMGLIEDPDTAVKIAKEVGFPVMIKASAGGGGKGMRIAWDEDEAREGFTSARNEAKTAFGDERIFIERFVTEPRHIEIQVLGDKHGNCIHLNERECSIQRRNQKVIEEAPSPFLDEKTRAAMGAQAIALAAAVDYDSAGTVEFIVDKDRNFFFLEMNTRLQVEHPVSEMITGVDLVEQMIRVAAGEKLSLKQKDIGIDGWAVETRIYAEDPYRNFLPSIGRLNRFSPPRQSDAVRLDTGVRAGDEVSIFYDPMLAKLITHGRDRKAAVQAMQAALDQFDVAGVQSNIPFLSAVIAQDRFQSGKINTAYIAEEFPDGFHGITPGDEARRLLCAAAVYMRLILRARASQISGRMTPPKPMPLDWVVMLDRQAYPVKVRLHEGGAEIMLDGKWHDLQSPWNPTQHVFEGTLDGTPFALTLENETEGVLLRYRGSQVQAIVSPPRIAELHALLPEKQSADTGQHILSPMPGRVVLVEVKPGQEVKAGEPVLVVEAMKMENIIRAERDGVIDTIHVAADDNVAADEVLVSFA
ncbi:MAG: acetyl/propionyl/methylcrotonyl-CoA carboxylase subunit alpha [Robiginitomaculum sp.]|nr:acetyl/propionyl/methylcrotonyl-CoA carboxylase subunit alpha [Robiginitomaculum sp.]